MFWNNNDSRLFKPIIQKVLESLETANIEISNHIVQEHETVEFENNSKQNVKTYHLSRYACSLILRYADPSNPNVVLGQSYFAIQTHELGELDEQSLEEQHRLTVRPEAKEQDSCAVESVGQTLLNLLLFWDIFDFMED